MALTQVQPGMLGATQPYNFKNRIINGAMVIDQRNAGASVTLSNSGFVYGVDRWAGITGLASSSTITTQRVSINSNGFQYGTRILRGSGTYTSGLSIIQEPESLNTYDLAGQTVTISYWARKGSSSTAITPYIQLVSGTGTDQGISGAYGGTWTGWANLGTSVPTLTTTLTQYTATFTVPSNATELAVLFSISGFSGTGSANDYIDITGVQLEVGVSATSFDYRAYGQELALCQRYFEKSYGVSVTPGTASTTGFIDHTGSSQAGSNAMYPLRFSVAKRTAPTITLYNVSTGASGSWDYVRNGASGTATANADSFGEFGGRTYYAVGAAWVVCDIQGQWTANAEL